jgi:hypothetical protein
MDHAGYSWTMKEEGEALRWSILPPGGGAALLTGLAPTRAMAAALVIRAIARGMTEAPSRIDGLAV